MQALSYLRANSAQSFEHFARFFFFCNKSKLSHLCDGQHEEMIMFNIDGRIAILFKPA